MRLADSSRKTIEDFYKFYLRDAHFRLPEMRFYAGGLTGIFTSLMRIHGITIGGKIFIAPELLFINSNGQKSMPDDLTVHEIMHVLQYRKKGFWHFLFDYFREYALNLRSEKSFGGRARNSAYFNIPDEREARDAAACFLNWKNEHRRR